MEAVIESPAVQSLYVFGCPSCGEELEAHAAQWCQCVVVRRVSLVCPRCGVCLCKASPQEQRQFWSNAPAWLTDSHAAEQRRRTATTAERAVEEVDVLIVDDDEEIRLLAAYNLQQSGYRVAVASGGQDALETLQRINARVMITDALMPKMDGRQLCKLVKAEHHEMKVVIMTSLYTAPHYKYEAFKTFRADEYLVKPIEFNQLREVMAKLAPRNV